MNERKKFCLLCYFSLISYISSKVIISFSTFPIFGLISSWDRLDQGNLISSVCWGQFITFFLSVIIIRIYNTKNIIILAHVWKGIFGILCLFIDASYYEFWTNLFFSSFADSFIIIYIFHSLLFWLPSGELVYTIFYLFTSIGFGYILGCFVSYYFIIYHSWQYCLGISSVFSIIVAFIWYRSSINIYPQNSKKISTAELTYIHNTHYNINRRDIKKQYFEMIFNFETFRFCVSGFCYGYIIEEILSYHGIYYLELVSIHSSFYQIPISIIFPWLWWILGSLSIGICLYFNLTIPCLQYKIQSIFIPKRNWILEGILLLLSFLLLYNVSPFPPITFVTIRFSPLYLLLSISFTSFIISHIHCEKSEPEFLLGLSFTCISFGGIISDVLNGLILNMAGAWTIIFRYMSYILLFSCISCYFIPFFLQKRKKKTAGLL